MAKTFKDRLKEQKPIFLDGGMGTQIAARGGKPGAASSIVSPNIILDIHSAYRDAGADVILTNTFSANRSALSRGNEERRIGEFIAASCSLARKAAGNNGWVAGDIGPTGDFLEPVGSISRNDMKAVFLESARLLATHGVDLFVVETMSDAGEAAVAVEACRDIAPQLAIAATMSFDPVRQGFRTNTGLTPMIAAKTLADAGADIVGANCGTVTPEQMAEIVLEMKDACGLPVLIKANAGLPELRAGNTVYNMSPESFAAGMKKACDAGALLLGGCCGTTPEHIRCLTRAIRDKVLK